MVFPIVGGTQDTSYEISNSLKFNDNDSPELYRTLGTPTNNKIYTFSMWVKRGCITGSGQSWIGHYDGSASNPFVVVQFRGDDSLRISAYDDETTTAMNLRTNARFRDHSAWYHIVLAFDTTQGTGSNRVKVYVNGNQVTSFHTETYPDQNKVLAFNKASTEAYYGVYKYGNSGSGGNFYDGYIAELHFIDGQQLAQTNFGKFDNNNVWIPIKYEGTYGDNGHFFEFKQTGTSANSSGMGADTSGNDNHFTLANLDATDSVEDTCTNNFATLNPLDDQIGSTVLADGMLDFTGHDGGAGRIISTIGVTAGKWYAEFKIKNTHKSRIGIIDSTGRDSNNALTNDEVAYDTPGGYVYTALNGTGNDTGANSQSDGVDVTNPSANDILGVALDADNEKVRFFLNNTALTSDGDGFTPLQRAGTDETYFFFVRDGSGSNDDVPNIIANFGNPPYTPSSVANDENGFGTFEYAPPSGFLALCTKNLGSNG